jgi:hypothetical protein
MCSNLLIDVGAKYKLQRKKKYNMLVSRCITLVIVAANNYFLLMHSQALLVIAVIIVS